jgi:hypothetical protein
MRRFEAPGETSSSSARIASQWLWPQPTMWRTRRFARRVQRHAVDASGAGRELDVHP